MDKFWSISLKEGNIPTMLPGCSYSKSDWITRDQRSAKLLVWETCATVWNIYMLTPAWPTLSKGGQSNSYLLLLRGKLRPLLWPGLYFCFGFRSFFWHFCTTALQKLFEGVRTVAVYKAWPKNGERDCKEDFLHLCLDGNLAPITRLESWKILVF